MADKTTKKISISGEIGWDYTSSSVKASLSEAKGSDLEIEIASPGGDVFDGIEIYNAIRDYKRQNPGAQIMGTLKGLVASMASYIASNPAFDLVAAEDNAVYMVHNPWMLAIGDYREMGKQADFLEGLAGILATAYVGRTGKKDEDIRDMMNNETWLFGSEIKDAGFVDEMIPCPDDACGPDKKKKAMSLARGSFDAMKRHAQEKSDAQKIAACIRDYEKVINPAPAEENKPDPQGSKGDEMPDYKTVAEFQAGSPTLAKEVKDSAVKEERARVVALGEIKKKYGSKVGAVAELADAAIGDGRTASDIALAVADLVAAAVESAPPLNTGAKGTASGETEPVAEADDKPVPRFR